MKNNQLTMTFQDGSTRTNVYDLANDIINYTDENGSSFANTFDALGRRTAVAIIGALGLVGTTSQSFQYDGPPPQPPVLVWKRALRPLGRPRTAKETGA